MKNAKRLCAFLALLALCSFASAETAAKKPKKPTKDEVVVVLSVQLSPGLNTSFYSNYNGYDPKEKAPFEPYVELVSEKKSAAEKGLIGKISGFKFKIPKSREILLYGFNASLASFHDITIILPVVATIAVPAGTNYVYLGDLTYVYAGDYFDVETIVQGDDFDGAKAYVREQYGDEAAEALIRVPLKPKKFDEK